MTRHAGGPHGRIAAWTMLCLVCLAAPAARAARWENVTVATRDGWEYTAMIVECSPGAATVTLVNTDGGRKSLPAAQLGRVQDALGQDITSTVLACVEAAAADSTPFAAPQTVLPPAAPPRRASPRWPGTEASPPAASGPGARPAGGGTVRFLPSVAIGFGQVAGDWFDGLTNGVAFDAGLRIGVADQVRFGLGFCYQKLGVESQFQQIGGYPTDWDVSLREYWFLIGFNSIGRRPAAPSGYAEVGLGAIVHHLAATAYAGGQSAHAETNESKFAMLAGVGAIVPIGELVGIDFGGTMRLTGSGARQTSYGTYSGTTGVVFGAHVGLVLLLGD